MTRKRFSVYDERGEFTGRVIFGPDEKFARANAPEDHGVVEGVIDRDTKAFDFATGAVIERAERRQPTVIEKSITAKRQIAQLEAKQARSIRELSIDPSNKAARDRLTELDDKIAEIAVSSGLRSAPVSEAEEALAEPFVAVVRDP